MFKKLITLMATVVLGGAMLGAGAACAHEGHDHGSATDHAASAEVPQKGELCPVSGEEIDPGSKITYTYKGKVYRFCCASCLDDFRKAPEKYIGRTKDNAAGVEEHEHR